MAQRYKDGGKHIDQQVYEAPTLQMLGSLAELTHGSFSAAEDFPNAGGNLESDGLG